MTHEQCRNLITTCRDLRLTVEMFYKLMETVLDNHIAERKAEMRNDNPSLTDEEFDVWWALQYE